MRAMIFDTETSGLIENRTIKVDRQPRIIEWYSCICDLSTSGIEHELEFLIYPTVKIDAQITAITGITNAMLVDKPKFVDVAQQIKTMIESAPVVIAHNCSFDTEMTDIEFGRLGQTIVWPRRLCTVESTVHVRGHRLTMTALHEHLFGEKFVDAHRAKADVAALMRCCVELNKRGWL